MAYREYQRLIALPLYPRMSDQDVEDVIEAVCDVVDWRLARQFRHRIYRVSEDWPRREMYGLTDQIRDAAVSITANIAEGYERYHYQENIQLRRWEGGVQWIYDYLFRESGHLWSVVLYCTYS